MLSTQGDGRTDRNPRIDGDALPAKVSAPAEECDIKLVPESGAGAVGVATAAALAALAARAGPPDGLSSPALASLYARAELPRRARARRSAQSATSAAAPPAGPAREAT